MNNNNNVRKHVDNMINTYCKCVIDLATRVTDRSKTLIDHIYFNENKRPLHQGVFVARRVTPQLNRKYFTL